MTASSKISVFMSLAIGLFGASTANATCSGSGLAWNCTAGSSVAQVQTALNSASDGATINLAAGSYSWGSSITLSNSKGVTLQGAGIDQTVVSVTGAPIIYMDTLSGNNTRIYRITGFTFQNAPSNLIFWFFGDGTMNKLRIDHNKFNNFAVGAIAIFLGETGSVGKFYGVIDHNTFSGSNNFMSLKYLGPTDPAQWPSALRGTSQNMFVEDNTYNFTTASDLGSGCVDVWSAGAIGVSPQLGDELSGNCARCFARHDSKFRAIPKHPTPYCWFRWFVGGRYSAVPSPRVRRNLRLG